MADITVIKKYEDSYRLNHPDFPQVYRSTYAKGVITDFKKVQDDPIQVVSQVTVKVGETEYDDWLPLFFHPKAQYWDDTEHKATDYNEEEKYFEKAWMSFRWEDEVAVMMCAPEAGDDLKPFAVVAFADGYPRIGENVLKIKGPTVNTQYGSTHYPPTTRSRYFKVTPSEYYGDENTDDVKGPDDINLRLDTEIAPVNSDYLRVTMVDPNWAADRQFIEFLWYYYKYKIPVGPLFIVLQATYYISHFIYYRTNWTIYTEQRYSSAQGPDIVVLLKDPSNRIEEMQYTLAERIGTYSWPYGGSPTWQLPHLYDTYADLEEGHLPQLESLISSWVNVEEQKRLDWTKTQVNVRPHTKEELQAAGMWPEAETE